MTLKMLLKSAIILSCMLVVNQASAAIVVVVNPHLSDTQLSAEDVKRIFLGKDTKFPSGEPAIPIEHKNDSDMYSVFHTSVTSKNPKQLRAYWSKLTFTGKGVPPREVTAEEVKTLVANNKNIIGYIDAAQVDDSVKVVLTID